LQGELGRKGVFTDSKCGKGLDRAT
jgi:hypothetical protein